MDIVEECMEIVQSFPDDLVVSQEIDPPLAQSSIKSSTEMPYDPLKKHTWEHLQFKFPDEAIGFYETYARFHGFCMRIGQRHKSHVDDDGVQHFKYMKLECSKGGVKKNKVDFPIASPRAIVKTGCEALMTVNYFHDQGAYRITKWDETHNHPMIEPDKRHLMTGNRSISYVQERVIDLLIDSGNSIRSAYEYLVHSHGGRENVGFLKVDMKNMLNRKREINMEPGEATVLMRWFREQSRTKPGFFYDVQVDQDEQIASIFWADAQMIADYAVFGDFLSFDTTYRTNKAHRPLGIFCGFNHHKGTCIFGGALLYDETTESFSWLFDAFMRCMQYKKPITLMTDQAPAIAAAAKVVFPDVFHALCSWHIRTNGEKNLGALATSKWKDEFNHLVHYVDDEPQFEYGWKRMIDECIPDPTKLKTTWLDRTYQCRQQWSSAWVKSIFTAGRSTTQLSEQLNAHSRFYLGPDLNLSNFFSRFERMVKTLRHNELTADYNMINRVAPNNNKNCAIMVQAAEVFTPAIFLIWQQQYDLKASFTMEIMKECYDGASKSIKVQRKIGTPQGKEEVLEDYIVKVDMATSTMKCTCRFYENWWILCRHIFRVMDTLGSYGNQYFQTIPQLYIQSRWTRIAKKESHVAHKSSQPSDDCYVGRYQQLCALIVAASPRICHSQPAYDVLLSHVLDGVRAAEEMLFEESRSSQPTNQCSSSSAGDTEFSRYTLKKKVNPITDRNRMKSEREKSQLRRKQKTKSELKRKKGD